MRILYISDARSIHTRRWAEYFRDCGHDVHIASFRDEKISGVKLHVLHTYGLGKIGYLISAFALRKIINEVNPDITHAQYITSYGFLAALVKANPLVLTSWGTDVLISPNESFILKLFAKYAIKHSNIVTTVAKHMIPAMEALGAKTGLVEAVPFGVDLQKFHMSNKQYSHPKIVNIISTRNFAEVYSIDTLLFSLKELTLRGVEFKLDLVGAGVLETELKEIVRNEGLANVVTFHGHVSSEVLSNMLREADIFVSSAISDGNNVSLNEAMACGCIPIATNIPANAQWIIDNENGYLFECKNSKQLAHSIIKAIAEPSWEKIVRNNREIVEKLASWDVCVTKMNDMYCNLVEK
jgi:glycosyltransferase involved in cell wall biosynthesis